MAAITICSDFGAPKNKVWHCFHCSPSTSYEVMGPDTMILVFWMLSFKPTFSLPSFTFIKRLFSSSSLSAIRVVSFLRSHDWRGYVFTCTSQILKLLNFIGTSLMAQSVKNPLAEQETEKTRVWSLGREDPLEKEMETHSSILAWKTPWTVEPGGLQSKGLQRVRHDWARAWTELYWEILKCSCFHFTLSLLQNNPLTQSI